jgi:hypothetical protein
MDDPEGKGVRGCREGSVEGKDESVGISVIATGTTTVPSVGEEEGSSDMAVSMLLSGEIVKSGLISDPDPST